MSIHPLSDNFVVLVERGLQFRAPQNIYYFNYFISLVSIDFYNATCKTIQTFEYTGSDLWFNVNKLDPTEFYLTLQIGDQLFTRICKLVGKSIVVGDSIEVPFVGRSYFEGCFYDLRWGFTVCFFRSFCLIFKIIGVQDFRSQG
jgi:hypothetical protein